ncbi:hypothetical protein Tco_0979704 [Tanacetum coccineum]
MEVGVSVGWRQDENDGVAGSSGGDKVVVVVVFKDGEWFKWEEDDNYHQLLSLIAEKMQKEKEQQDKLKAVKARLLYGNESGRNPRIHEESHYSESKTPTARTEPRRRHERKHSRSPSPIASVFRRLKQNRSPSHRLHPRKEGGVFNRLGRKEPGMYTRSDSHH